MGSKRDLFTDWIRPLITLAFLVLLLASSRPATPQAPVETATSGVEVARPC